MVGEFSRLNFCFCESFESWMNYPSLIPAVCVSITLGDGYERMLEGLWTYRMYGNATDNSCKAIAHLKTLIVSATTLVSQSTHCAVTVRRVFFVP